MQYMTREYEVQPHILQLMKAISISTFDEVLFHLQEEYSVIFTTTPTAE